MVTNAPHSLEKKNSVKERQCIITRQAGKPSDMLRFVENPEGYIVPDIKAKLPGRGAWIFTRHTLVEEAIKRNVFTRSFKKAVKVPEDLARQVDNLLLKAALANLSLARRSGAVITGSAKVEAAIRAGRVAMVLHASDGAPDGKRKIAQAVYAYENGLDKQLNSQQKNLTTIKTLAPFNLQQLQIAFGEQNVVHIAIMRDRGAESFIKAVSRLVAYRNKD